MDALRAMWDSFANLLRTAKPHERRPFLDKLAGLDYRVPTVELEDEDLILKWKRKSGEAAS